LALQAKVDLDLPKFELLLSVSKDCGKQDLSSTTEGIAFDSMKNELLVCQGKPSSIEVLSSP
jgi:hypothetical protein